MAVVVRKSHSQPPDCSASIATVAKNGALVLLDVASGQVVRVERQARYWDGYEDARERFSTYVPSVPFKLLGGRVLSEPLVSGRSFKDLTLRQQLESVRSILGSYSELVANDRSGSSAPYVEDVLAKTRQIAISSSLEKYLPLTWLSTRARHWPLVISHGDTLPRNFIFSDTGPVLIDFDPALLRPRPFWFDPIKVFLSWDSEEIVKSLLLGHLDSELDELWRAAGAPPTDRVEPLELLAAASLLVGYAVSGDGKNLRKFQRRATKAWAVVRSARRTLRRASRSGRLGASVDAVPGRYAAS